MTMVLQQGSKVVFFGDSLTLFGANANGYIDLMRKWLAANLAALNVTLIGAGVGSNNVNHLRLRFDRDVKAKTPTHVVIFIGVNDAGKTMAAPVIQPAAFESGLRELVARTTAINAVPILATLAIRGEKTDGTNAVDARLDQYAQITRDVATSTGSQLIDVRNTFLDLLRTYNVANAAKGMLASDGVHCTLFGQGVLAALFLRELVDRGIS